MARRTVTAFYNEIDPRAAEWLRELIKAGQIAPGIICEDSIEDLHPTDLRGFTQCHFFGGIGVWSHALRQAGWPDDQPIWTGSCPCQPFSAAGKSAGFADERHLWPAFFHLIQNGKPRAVSVIGEQVASKDGLAWLDLVHADLEGAGYTVGAVDTCAAGFGAPHQRQRLYWVGYPNGAGRQQGVTSSQTSGYRYSPFTTGGFDELGYSIGARLALGQWDTGVPGRTRISDARKTPIGASLHADQLADTLQPGWSTRRAEPGNGPAARSGGVDTRPGPVNGFWADADWILCTDGKWRAIEPGLKPLAHGTTGRMVCMCTSCKTETVIHEGVQFLWKIDRRFIRPGQKEILQQRMFQAAPYIETAIEQKYGALSRESDRARQIMREVWGNGQAAASPQRPQRDERGSIEFRNSLFYMSSYGAPERSAAFDLCGLQESFQSSVTSSPTEQNMFCPVCERMGPHMCKKEMGRNRVMKLRGYGNAICAPQATGFIEAVMAELSRLR